MRLLVYTFFLLASLATIEATSQNVQQDSLLDTSKIKSKVKEKKIPYFFYLQYGALVGCNNCSVKKEFSFTASTVHGLSLGEKLRVGAGIGFDSYTHWLTVPAFGSVSWDLIGSKDTNALFIQLNYGWARPLQDRSERAYGYKDADGGKIFGLNLGYRIRYHDLRIAFALGIKDQKISSYYEYPTYRTTITGQTLEGKPSTQTIKEELSRFQFTMAIGLM